MWRDSIVEEVRQAREAHAKKFNYDLWAIYEDLKKIEEECGLEVVSFPPKPARFIKLGRRLSHAEAAKSLTNAPYQISNESMVHAFRESDAERWGEDSGQEEDRNGS